MANRRDPIGNTKRPNNVLPFTPRRRAASPPILRLSPEYDGMELLYANDQHPDTLFSVKILAWARLENGETLAMVPWLRKLASAHELADPLNGRWEGYRLPESDYLFCEAPPHKVQELDAAVSFFGKPTFDNPARGLVQEIPDTIGTHAVLSDVKFQTMTLKEVVSWRLLQDGTVSGMLIDDSKLHTTPVLPGDDCLFEADKSEDFRYFFQHHIANKLKSKDPEALAAISLLVES